MSDFNDIVNNFFKNYHDRGMKKWAGYYLSDHTQKIEKDKAERDYQVVIRPKQSETEISESLLSAFSNRNHVTVQIKDATLDSNKIVEISGFVSGYQEEIVYLDNQAVNLNEIINIQIK